jgi:hypothetical protein
VQVAVAVTTLQLLAQLEETVEMEFQVAGAVLITLQVQETPLEEMVETV